MEKLERGTKCYFDKNCHTNRPDIKMVTVIKPNNSRHTKYVVVVDKTKEVIIASEDHLTPVKENSDAPILVAHNPLSSVPFTAQDVKTLSNIIELFGSFDKVLAQGDFLKCLQACRSIFGNDASSIIQFLELINSKIALYVAQSIEVANVETISRVLYEEETRDDGDRDNEISDRDVDAENIIRDFVSKLSVDAYTNKQDIVDQTITNFPYDIVANDPRVNKTIDHVKVLEYEGIDALVQHISDCLETYSGDDDSFYVVVPFVDKDRTKTAYVFENNVDSYDDIYDKLITVFRSNNLFDKLPEYKRRSLLEIARKNNPENEAFVLPSVIRLFCIKVPEMGMEEMTDDE